MSTISSVITPVSASSIGSSAVAWRPMRFVIILPSLRTRFSRGASFVRGILNPVYLVEREIVGLLPLISLMFLLFFAAYRACCGSAKYRAAIITCLIKFSASCEMLIFPLTDSINRSHTFTPRIFCADRQNCPNLQIRNRRASAGIIGSFWKVLPTFSSCTPVSGGQENARTAHHS